MRSLFRTLVIGVIAFLQTVAPIAHAQTAGTALPDGEPPIIEIEEIRAGVAAGNQVFTAQVVDNKQLVDVILYHRRAGQQAFTRNEMKALAETSFYSATIPTPSNDLRAIEYYVQARDEGGNRTVYGFAFDPLIRSLEPADGTAPTSISTADQNTSSASSSAEPQISTRSRVRWWHIALGVVAAGAIAAAAGGGSDGSGDGTVPLTINLGEPQ